MGRVDTLTNEYMSDNERFADVFNFFLYDGEQVIDPTRLKELDRTAVALPYGNNSQKSDVVQKYRDVFKLLVAMEDDNATYLLLGVEDQRYVHYAMLVKNMLYDATQYAKQVEQISKAHREKKDVSGDEFLSGLTKEDKLLPVITLVIYWSPDEWDGPRNLHDMISVTDKSILKYVPDYRINLITPNDIDDKDFKKFHTVLAKAFQFIKYSNDQDGLSKIVNDDLEYEHMDRRTVEVLNEVTRAGIIIPEGAREVNMCQAIEGMKQEAVDNTLVESIKNLMKNLKMTAEQAMDALGVSSEDRKKYVQML